MRGAAYIRSGFCAAFLAVVGPLSALSGDLERGIAITDPLALRELDLVERPGASLRPSLSLAMMLGAPADALSGDIFLLASMKPLRAALDRDFDDYFAKVTPSGVLAPFDRDALYAKQTRFILSGVVNRMDRAFKSPATCGEIRLIYRPIANYGKRGGNGAAQSLRLPMTLNLVLNARNQTERQTVSCADIARRWLALSDDLKSGHDLAATLAAKGGALEFVTPAHIDRIETNMQIAHASANPNDFDARADYLMKVFNYDAASKSFVESPMENQIDRDRLLAKPQIAADFKRWLIAAENLIALDRGIALMPERFLATRAIVVTPAVQSNIGGLFSESEEVEILARASANLIDLDNLKSPAGFERRLNDSTCAGCHQTRSIGGFHFPGADWSGDPPPFVVTPASPHFFGDQPRRRDILMSFRDTKPLDFSRGFSARPQARRSNDLNGTTYLNGWGAHCYAPTGKEVRADKSFASWACIPALDCQMPERGGSAIRAGLCFPEN